jgi:hypothetical protein
LIERIYERGISVREVLELAKGRQIELVVLLTAGALTLRARKAHHQKGATS